MAGMTAVKLKCTLLFATVTKTALQLTGSPTQISTESSILIGECDSTMKPTIHVHLLPRLRMCVASPLCPLYTK